LNTFDTTAAAELAAEGHLRIALGVEYKGSRYRGWQRQASGVLTVQETLEKALSRVADSPVSLMCAGRTDAGVHACGQVVHFDTQAVRSLKAWVMGANINLPHDVSVSWARVMPAHFHARFKAIARRYRYVIYNDPIRPAQLGEEVTWNHRPLDVRRMAEAAAQQVHHLRVSQHGKMIVLDIRANAFLHHMVRNIAGVLMTIGAGEREPGWAREVLDSRVRRSGGVTAHPYGLYLVQVEYRDEFELPERYVGPHFLTGFDFGPEADC
jgi:tRNA pseudouridine38-40 synthase